MQAHVGDLAVRRGAEVDRRDRRRRQPPPTRPRGTPRWSRPGRGRGCARARGRARSTVVCVGQQVDEQLHLVDEGRGERLHALDGDAGRDLVGQLEQLRVRRAELGRAAAYVLGQQQLAARRRPQSLDRRPGCAGRRPRRRGSPRPRRPRTPPAAGAPRSAGRRRRCRRGRRTRRASPPCRPGSTPRPRARGRRRRGPWSRPGRARRARGRPGPGTCGWRIDRIGATTTASGPLVASVAGVAQPPEHGQPATDGVAARAQPLVRQRLPARVVGDRRGVDEVGQLLHEVLGLPRRRGHGQHGAPALHQPVHHEGAHGGRAGQVEGRLHRPVGERGAQGGGRTSGVRRRDEWRGRHGSDPSGARRQTPIRDREGGA